MIENLDAVESPMREKLTQALRERNVCEARAIMLQTQQRMGEEYVANLLWSAIERLAWHEGYSPAARWLMRNSPRTLRQNLPLR